MADFSARLLANEGLREAFSFAGQVRHAFAAGYAIGLTYYIFRFLRRPQVGGNSRNGKYSTLGQASLRMEQTLWPEDYERMTREIEAALREADDPNARSYTHEEVMQAMQERIDLVRNTPC